MKQQTWQTLLALAVFNVTNVAIAQEDLPDPSQAYVEAFSGAGSGCAPGTATAAMSSDKKSLTVQLAKFQLESGRQLGQTRKESSCFLQLRMHVPAGYAFSISSVDTKGNLTLDAKSRANVRTEFRWGHSPVGLTPMAQESSRSSQNQGYLIAMQDRTPAPTWSSCSSTSQAMTLRTTLAVAGNNDYITVNPVDASLTQKYRINWRRCSESLGTAVKQMWTKGAVAQDSLVCMNHARGEIATYAKTSLLPNQPYARLNHTGVTTNNQTREMSKESFERMRWMSYKAPGDWKEVSHVRPKVEWKAVIGGTYPEVKVAAMSSDMTCVEVQQAPATVLIKWNPT